MHRPIAPAQFFLTLVQDLLEVPTESLAEVLIEQLCAYYGARFACLHLDDEALQDRFPGAHRRCPAALAPRSEMAPLMRAESSWLRLTRLLGRPVSLHEAIRVAPPAMLLRNYFLLTDGLSVPLLYQGEQMGTLNLYLQERVLSPAEAQALSCLGGVVYGLIKRSQMTQEIAHRDGVISALARSVEAKDPYTGQHLERVRYYAARLAQALSLPDEEVHAVDQAALLHDIGKIGVPDAVLTKEGALDDQEWDQMRRHPLIGSEILRESENGTLRRALPGIRWHHERPDGRGYPDGLKGEEIPLIARIIAVADAYDALTSDRPYRKGMTPEGALEILRTQAGKQFCPLIVERFISDECYKREEASYATV